MTSVSSYRDCCYCLSPKFPEADLKPVTDQTSEEWKQVIVLKKDKDGEFIKDASGKPIQRSYILHVPSGDIYLDEEPATVATKCALISFGTIFYTLGTMFYHLGKIVADTARIGVRTIQETGRQFKEKGFGEASKTLLKGFFWHLPKAVLYDLWCVVCDPFYGIAVEFSAIVGVFSPYKGRRWIALCEHSWHCQTSYKKDPRYDTDCENISCPDLMKVLRNSEVFYLAFCMQSRGNIKNNKNLVVKVRV